MEGQMLGQASSQWSSRPADQRFWSLADLHAATTVYKDEAKTAAVPPSALRVEKVDNDLRLLGRTGIPAKLTHYAFGQLARLGGAPAGYLASLPATLAAQNLNHALATRAKEDDRSLALLFRVNGAMELRAAVTETYDRIWNSDITGRLAGMEEKGWRVPPAMKAPVDGVGTRVATSADCGDYTLVQVGDTISPSGLYASDRDMFVFMVHPERVVRAGKRSLFRGFFLWNSEVGDKSLGISTFLFDYVCFNHNVWGAERLADVRIRHVGDASGRWAGQVGVELRKYAEQSAGEDEQRISKAMSFRIAASPADVVDKLFGMKALGLSRSVLEQAQMVATRNVDDYGDPLSAWGMAQGLTEVSQQQPYAEARVRLDRAAGRVVEMAF